MFSTQITRRFHSANTNRRSVCPSGTLATGHSNNYIYTAGLCYITAKPELVASSNYDLYHADLTLGQKPDEGYLSNVASSSSPAITQPNIYNNPSLSFGVRLRYVNLTVYPEIVRSLQQTRDCDVRPPATPKIVLLLFVYTITPCNSMTLAGLCSGSQLKKIVSYGVTRYRVPVENKTKQSRCHYLNCKSTVKALTYPLI